jgi:hypothetical protein
MATVRKSIIIEKFSGKLYGVVFKQYRHGVVVSRRPDMSNIKRSESQKKCNKTFAEAVVYAKEILYNPEKRNVFIKRIADQTRARKRSIYHMALREYYQTKKAGGQKKTLT